MGRDYQVRAEIISVGTELLLGEITDTNAAFLAGQLPSLGIELYWISQVDDNQARLVEVLKRAWQRSDVVLVTGGLGPTGDDLTREAIAELMAEEPKVEPSLEKELRSFFTRHGAEMSPGNLKQAWLIPSARALKNIRGTAPGWWVQRDGHTLVAMPGPPREMQPVWQNEVMPRIKRMAPVAIIYRKTYKTFGLSESKVGDLVSSLFSSVNPALGIYAKPDGIQLRLSARAESEVKAKELIAPAEKTIYSVLGQYIWGIDDDTLEVAVGRLLSAKGLSVAAMESFSGGLLSSILTEEGVSSPCFKGGLVACSDEAKIAGGIDGAVVSRFGGASSEVASEMARVVREKLGADVGIAINGDTSPETAEALPVGPVYIAIAGSGGVTTVEGNYPGTRSQVRRRAVTGALFELRKMLAEI